MGQYVDLPRKFRHYSLMKVYYLYHKSLQLVNTNKKKLPEYGSFFF